MAGLTGTVLASGQSQPSTVINDSSNVYWTAGGAIYKIAKGGGTITTIASSTANPYGLAADSSYMYWVDYQDNNAKKVSLSGGTVTTLASNLNGPHDITIDSSYIYYTNSSGVFRLSKLGGIPTQMSTLPCVSGVISDVSNLYFLQNCLITGDHGIWALPKIGGTPVKIADVPTPGSIAVALSYVFWVDSATGKLNRVSSIGGAVTAYGPGGSAGGAVAIDPSSTYAYWTTGTAVYKTALPGSTTTSLGSVPSAPNGWSADGTYAFWSDYGLGEILKAVH